MKTYLVGGCVRDKLLSRPVQDRDWVVVGADPQQMLAAGFKSVGKDFPVFLHPQTAEEYALARTERKTAPGYAGFEFHAAADVSLEEDLLRRDLTINAMAEDEDGQIIDPYGGLADLQQRSLRHISPAFAEDPVRILRVARFAARFADLGFRVADDTMALMQTMVNNGEVDALVAERVWQEMQRALSEDSPQVFIEVLRQCGALARLFPELDRLFGVPQPEQYHPEVDTGIHTLLVLQQSARLSTEVSVRFAALTHDLGKGVTPEDQWPKHINHEENGVPLVEALCERLRVPRDYRELAVHVARYHLHFHRALELKPSSLVDLIHRLDGFRRPQRFEMFLLACEADARGRPGYEDRDMPQTAFLQTVRQLAAQIDSREIIQAGFSGPQIAEQLRKQRIARVKRFKTEHAQSA